MSETDFLVLEGPVERRGDRLVLRVPMDGGGERLKRVARSVSCEEDGKLVVLLPDWLARRMHLDEGTAVHVDDRWGKLNISRLH